MSAALIRLVRRRLFLVTMLAIVAMATSRSAGGGNDPVEFRGACYCRAQNELMCSPNLTARECDLRSKHALCDEWFWKERLPCWNWGYGG